MITREIIEQCPTRFLGNIFVCASSGANSFSLRHLIMRALEFGITEIKGIDKTKIEFDVNKSIAFIENDKSSTEEDKTKALHIVNRERYCPVL